MLSLVPSAETVPPEIVHSDSSADLSGAEIFNAIGNNPVYYDLGIQNGSIVFNEYSAPDGKYEYVFRKDGDKLVFNALKSSPMPSYKYLQGAEEEVCLPDGAVFTRYI